MSKTPKTKFKRIVYYIGIIGSIFSIIFIIVMSYDLASTAKELKASMIKFDLELRQDISVGILQQASLINKNMNLFIKEFNKKYKTNFVYKVKLSKETKQEKYIEAIKMIYGIQNGISKITYAIKEDRKTNDPNKVILNMRRYQTMPEEIVMLDKKIGSLIETMNTKYKTKFMYKLNILDIENHKKSRVADINYMSAINVQIEEMYNFIREWLC